MLTANLDGSDLQIYARGLRNSIDFDWTPWSGELYATDNGRDMLGDNFPPDELNLIQQGGFYGWPTTTVTMCPTQTMAVSVQI